MESSGRASQDQPDRAGRGYESHAEPAGERSGQDQERADDQPGALGLTASAHDTAGSAEEASAATFEDQELTAETSSFCYDRPASQITRNDGSVSTAAYRELEALAANDVVAHLPRYAAPNIAATLPSYRNGEQDFIHRTFHVGNYDQIRHLPVTLKEHQVTAQRTQRMDAAHAYLMPALTSQPRIKGAGPDSTGLFSNFEYIPSKYSLADELASKDRVARETVRLTVGGGKEFLPAVAPRMAKHEDLDPARGYLYLSGPQEAADELAGAQRALHESKFISPTPFLPAGARKLAVELPNKPQTLAMMSRLKALLAADWEGVALQIFENEHDCWVVSFEEASVDSLAGLAAYMNVFVRTNPAANEYKLTKVVEFWGSRPGDGHAYFVLRPPWVANDHLSTFYALHPDERDWRTSFPVLEMEKERQALKKAYEAGDDELADLQGAPTAAAAAVAASGSTPRTAGGALRA